MNLKSPEKKSYFNKIFHILMISIITILFTYLVVNSTNNSEKQDQLFEDLRTHMLKEEVQLDSINKRIDSIT